MALDELIEYGINSFIEVGEADKNGVYPEYMDGRAIREMKDYLKPKLQALVDKAVSNVNKSHDSVDNVNSMSTKPPVYVKAIMEIKES